MNPLFEPVGLRSPDGREAQLLSVQLHGELLGLMLRLTVQQTWRNTSGAPMATRLAFALAPEQCLLDLRVLRAQGPQPIHSLTRHSQQVCHAGFGVMHTGEQVTLQWRIGQLLDLQGGSLRLQWPAAWAPPAVRAARVHVELHDPLARGTLGSTSHELQKVRHANGLSLRMVAPHGLDKDLALSVHGLRETCFALASPDRSRPGQGTLLLSQSVPPDAAASPQRLRLKLVLDHSGAIGQERQGQIQQALDRLVADLQPEDQLSCTRVGQGLSHDLPRLQPCTEAYVRRARALMRQTATGVGVGIGIGVGTPDWTSVLEAIVQLRDEDEEAVQDASILLVTAQPLSAIGGLVPLLRAHGHRLHVLAVGAAASASAWPRLARASGGRCASLNPGQHSLQTLQRLLERMRTLQPVGAALALEGQALGQVHQDHDRMAAEDTLHLWGPFDSPPTPDDLAGCPQWKARLQWQTPGTATPAPQGLDVPVLWEAEGDLTRVCASREVQLLGPGPVRDALIERHQLCLPDEGPTAMAPEKAAPPGPVGSRPAAEVKVLAQRTSPAHTTAAHTSPAHTRPAPSARPSHPLAALVQQFNQQAPAYQQFRAALSATLQRSPTRTVEGLVMALTRRAGNPGRVWALLLYFWHAEHEQGLHSHALQLVEQELASMPLTLRTALTTELTAQLTGVMQTTRQAA